jgi:predicted transcriptional regulator
LTVNELVSALPVTVIAASGGMDKPVEGGYVSDLLSNVMGFARQGSVWITLQGHPNVIAVASLTGLAAVIIAGGVQPDSVTVQKAESEGVVLLTSGLPAFELVGRLYALGIKGV